MRLPSVEIVYDKPDDLIGSGKPGLIFGRIIDGVWIGSVHGVMVPIVEWSAFLPGPLDPVPLVLSAHRIDLCLGHRRDGFVEKFRRILPQVSGGPVPPDPINPYGRVVGILADSRRNDSSGNRSSNIVLTVYPEHLGSPIMNHPAP